MPPPLFHQSVVALPIGRNALLPDRERPVVERERLRNLGCDADLLRVGVSA